MHPRHRFLDGTDDIQVSVAREARMDAPLQAYFGRARGRRLNRAARHFVEFEIVCGAPQILGPAALRERAETAMVEADVGVVDVSIDDVGDRVAHRLATQA